MSPNGQRKLFQKGHKKLGGRRKGVPNKIPGSVKQAAIDAATRLGLDGHGFAGLEGFMIRVGILEPEALMRFLGSLVAIELRQKPTVEYETDLSRFTAEEYAAYVRLWEKCRPPPPPEEEAIDMDALYKKMRQLADQRKRKQR